MAAGKGPIRSFKYYDLVMASFVTVLLCSNLIGAVKISAIELPWIGTFHFSAAVLFFPLSYIFGDILTEVYGYARGRKVVWAGFAAMVFAAVMSMAIIALPPAPGWGNQAAVEAIFGATWRIVVGSLVAFFIGEFANSYVLAKMKIFTAGRLLWARTIGSTVVGQAVDTVIFYPIAFYGLWPNDLLIKVLLSNYLVKVGVEVFMTPATYVVVGFLKKEENVDHYDRDTDFTPFSLDT